MVKFRQIWSHWKGQTLKGRGKQQKTIQNNYHDVRKSIKTKQKILLENDRFIFILCSVKSILIGSSNFFNQSKGLKQGKDKLVSGQSWVQMQKCSGKRLVQLCVNGAIISAIFKAKKCNNLIRNF